MEEASGRAWGPEIGGIERGGGAGEWRNKGGIEEKRLWSRD
jgi:hypothetical protein